MADLDDFFAKKDRRQKNKKKTKPLEMLEKKLEDVNRSNQERSRRVGDDDDEWNNFEEEKDYSGLKIQALSLEEEEAQREAEEEAKKAAEQAQEPVWAGDSKTESKSTAKATNDEEEDLPEFLLAFKRRTQVRIDDVIEFPSLGTPAEAYEEIQGFQTVRSGQTNLNPNQGSGRDNIKTTNKFNALRD